MSIHSFTKIAKTAAKIIMVTSSLFPLELLLIEKGKYEAFPMYRVRPSAAGGKFAAEQASAVGQASAAGQARAPAAIVAGQAQVPSYALP
jgi:hypothetical protein